MAELLYYVNTDADAGGDGTTNGTSGASCAFDNLADFAALDLALATSGNYARCLCSAPSGTADTLIALFDGWTTSATEYILIESSDDHGGTWDATKYTLNTVTTAALDIRDSNVRVKGLQVSGGTGGQGIQFFCGDVQDKNYQVEKCIVTTASAVHDAVIVNVSGGTETLTVWNSIFFDAGDHGIDIPTLNVANIYNSTFVDNTDHGISITTGTLTIKNCLFYNNGLGDVTGTLTSTYCATEETSGNSGLSGGTGDIFEISDPFVSYAGDNFHITSGSGPHDAGDDPSAGFTDDIDSITRTGTWDIGADEYVSSTEWTTHEDAIMEFGV